MNLKIVYHYKQDNFFIFLLMSIEVLHVVPRCPRIAPGLSRKMYQVIFTDSHIYLLMLGRDFSAVA